MGFRQALERADLPVDPSLELSVRHWHRADGAPAARALLAAAPARRGGVLQRPARPRPAARTGRSRGARAGRHRGDRYRRRRDGRYVRPSLSTVALDKRQIADAAVELLAARVAGDEGPRVRSPPATGSSSVSRRSGKRPRASRGSGRSGRRRAAPAADAPLPALGRPRCRCTRYPCRQGRSRPFGTDNGCNGCAEQRGWRDDRQPRARRTEPSGGAELPSTRSTGSPNGSATTARRCTTCSTAPCSPTSRSCGTGFRWSCPCCTPGTASACCCTAPRVGDCCARPRRTRR